MKMTQKAIKQVRELTVEKLAGLFASSEFATDPLEDSLREAINELGVDDEDAAAVEWDYQDLLNRTFIGAVESMGYKVTKEAK